MTGLHFFLVRRDNDAAYYTVVVEGMLEEVRNNLFKYFHEVRFIKSEHLDCETAQQYKGNRKLGNGLIRGCWFTQELRTMGKFCKPIKAEPDPRYQSDVRDECA